MVENGIQKNPGPAVPLAGNARRPDGNAVCNRSPAAGRGAAERFAGGLS